MAVDSGELIVLSSKDELNALHSEIVRNRLDAIQNAIKAGKILQKWKDNCHGEYMAKVDQYFKGSQRTALDYRKAHETWSEMTLDQRKDFKSGDCSIKALLPPKSKKVEVASTKATHEVADTSPPKAKQPKQDASTEPDGSESDTETAASGNGTATEDAGGTVECTRCGGSGRVPITAKMPATLAASPEFVNSWQDYQLFRIEKKHKLTTIGIGRIFKKLERWGPGKATAALERTMENGWLGVFEENGKSKSDPRGNMATLEAYIDGL